MPLASQALEAHPLHNWSRLSTKAPKPGRMLLRRGKRHAAPRCQHALPLPRPLAEEEKRVWNPAEGRTVLRAAVLCGYNFRIDPENPAILRAMSPVCRPLPASVCQCKPLQSGAVFAARKFLIHHCCTMDC